MSSPLNLKTRTHVFHSLFGYLFAVLLREKCNVNMILDCEISETDRDAVDMNYNSLRHGAQL